MRVLEYCQKVSKVAYDQEMERQQEIRRKTEFMFKWLTLIISVFSIVVPVVSKKNQFDCNDKVFRIIYILLMLLLMLDMVIVIFLNVPIKTKRYPCGSDIMKQIQQNRGDYDDMLQLYQDVMFLDILTNKVSVNNDRAVKMLFVANIILALALFGMASLFIYIMWGM